MLGRPVLALRQNAAINAQPSDELRGVKDLYWQQGKRLFIKDMAQYLVPPNGKPASIAPSLLRKERGVGTESDRYEAVGDEIGSKPDNTTSIPNGHILDTGTNAKPPYPTDAEPGNPTVIPAALLEKFHWTFLIRHPRNSIPSYYRCTIPPLDKITGFYNFRPDEAGYNELRRTFDYLRHAGCVGPAVAGQTGRTNGKHATNENSNGGDHHHAEICVIDADDLLDNPSDIISAFCETVGIDYSPDMLNWDNEESHKHARNVFQKWKGFHDDAIHSKDLKPRQHVSRNFDAQPSVDADVSVAGEEAENRRPILCRMGRKVRHARC